MSTILLGLAFAGAAAAQAVNVNGASMVTLSYASATTSASDNSYYGSSAPPQVTDYASSTTDTSNAQYTPPPSTYDIYSAMPYDSMTAGGYSSLNCGYGYTKAYDGSCQAESWVGSHAR